MSLFTEKNPAVGARGIHLDLKGLPPSPGRLLELLDIISAARFNRVLVEWEDAYPWKTHPVLRSGNGYSRSGVEKFLKKAARLGIEIIPLVQCFGHMENVLSKRQFAGLREENEDVSALCPSRERSGKIVIDMLADVLETHGGMISRFHLGGDEVRSFGSCKKCEKTVRRKGKPALYAEYVMPIAEFLLEKGLTPILWDDMMRSWTLKDLSGLSGAELMAWAYGPEPFGPDSSLSRENIDRYLKAGIGVWGASAFKGADGSSADIPDIERRMKNCSEWVKEHKRSGLRGVVATGWSRYSTFRVQCEGLESSLDSLVLAGDCLWSGRAGSAEEARSFLLSGAMEDIAGERFMECRRSSLEMDEWRRGAAAVFHEASALACISEPGRINPKTAGAVIGKLDDTLARGRKIRASWERAHKGLTRSVWARGYTDSRFLPVKHMLETLKHEIRGCL